MKTAVRNNLPSFTTAFYFLRLLIKKSIVMFKFFLCLLLDVRIKNVAWG